MTEPGGPDDPPDEGEFTFDEDFIRAAPVTEPSAEDRRRLAEKERRARAWDREVADAEAAAIWEQRTTRRRRRRRGIVAVLAAVALVAAGLTLDRFSMAPPRDAASRWNGSLVALGTAVDGGGPTPQTPASPVRLGTAPEPPETDEPFRFIADDGEGDPVTYDPCRPIRYVVNPLRSPDGAGGLLADAIARVEAATGLVFEADPESDGVTDELPTEQREPFQPEVYGDRWAPVLIAWLSPEEAPELAGPVAGFAGSAWLSVEEPSGRPVRTYVSGVMVLDGPQIAEIEKVSGRAAARAVILHELAHLVGLDHVADRTQIMNPRGSDAVTDFAAGDRAGLAELGRGDCVPLL